MFRPGVHTPPSPVNKAAVSQEMLRKRDAPGLGLCSLYWALEFHSFMVLLKHFKTN